MSKFLAAIHESLHNRNHLYALATEWSWKLKSAMGLDSSDTKAACEMRVEWRVGEYIISAEQRLHGDWTTVLEARPSGGRLPDDWTTVGVGTCSVIVPSASAQEEILRAIRDY